MAVLRALPGHAPRSLAALFEFNLRNGPAVVPHFGQEIFVRAEATSGDPADPAAQATRAETTGRGCRLLGPAWSEPALIGLAYAFEQASQALSWLSLQGTLTSAVGRSDSLRSWIPGVA